MNAHEEAWGAVEREINEKIASLERDFARDAEALARYAACVREPGDTLTVGQVASYATRLSQIQIRIHEYQDVLARMGSTIGFATRAAR